MIKILQSYDPHDLAKQINEILEEHPKNRLITVTVGPDNGPDHRLGAEIYTAWLEDLYE
jgi:hypothetical protein